MEGSRLPWLALLACTGITTALAVIFAGLWWRGEFQTDAAQQTLDRMTTEAARMESEHSRQRRVLTATKADTSQRLISMADETANLRAALEEAKTAAATAQLNAQTLTAQLAQRDADERQRTALLNQERFRSTQLEQNLTLTQNDSLQRTVEQERRIETIQTHLIYLRDTVTQREIEVRHITSAAQDEIGRTQRAAQEIAVEAEWLANQLRTVSCERDRLRSEVNQLQGEVSRLEQCLAQERHENQGLRSRIHQLECRIQELERRPVPQPGPAPATPLP